MMNFLSGCVLMISLGQAQDNPAGAPAAGAPQKKQVPEGNSDLQKLTPAVLQDLAKRIETALINDASTGSLGLRVNVEDQVLALSGDAPDESARKRASDLATNVANDELYRITNRIRVRAAGDVGAGKKGGVSDTPTGPDLAQLERVDAILREKAPELARTIRARFRLDPLPCVVLEGVVDTMEQKLEVSRTIRAEVRSLPLLNNIQIRLKRPASPARTTPAAETKQPRQMGGPQNKAIAIDSDTREEDVPLAGAVAQKIMGDARIWDTVVLLQADGGVIWLKGTVETFAMKVRCVNFAQRTQGVSYVIDDLTVAVALRGAQELSTAKQKQADNANADEEAMGYFQRYLGESVPVAGGYSVESREGTIHVILKKGVLSPEEMKRISDSVTKMAADLGVKAVVDMKPADGAPPAPSTPPQSP